MGRLFALCLVACLAPGPSLAAGWGDLDGLIARSFAISPESASWFPNHADPAQATEALAIAYAHIPGSAGNVSIHVGHFVRQDAGFVLRGVVQNLFGHGPREPAYFPDRIEITTTVLLPGEPRCCPTGVQRWAIDRASLAVTRLP